jgi:hypothetical protein
MTTITYIAELTDTFGGEANYSWVQRVQFQVPETADNRTLLAAVKSALGLTAKARTRPVFYGDELELRFPKGACLVAFAYPA